MTKRIIYYVVWDDEWNRWQVKRGFRVEADFPTKKEAIAAAVKRCREIEAKGLRASLVIKKQNGQFQEERTYPRISDPRKSKG